MTKPVADRLLRFTLHTSDDVDPRKLQACVDQALGRIALDLLPDLLRTDKSFWDYHGKHGRRPDRFDLHRHLMVSGTPPYFVDDALYKKREAAVSKGESAEIPFRLEELVPEEAKRTPKLAPRLGRHRFFILTLPYYEGTFRRKQCKPNGALFDIGYALREQCKLASAVPDIEYPGYQLLSSLMPCDCPSGTSDPRWHLDNIGYAGVPNNINGAGVRIGHPDTGFTRHAQLNFDAAGNSSSFDLTADFNVFDPLSGSAEEGVPAAGAPLTNPFHGTATAGVFVSQTEGTIDGLAPGATVVSIRCVNSVVLIADINVAQAVVAAVDGGAQVISISLGGYPAPVLEWAIAWAVAQNVIVVAAAGNVYPLVVYPAAYPACIGVGASTIDDGVWSGSARDWSLAGAIDIAAPGECVWNPSWSGSEAIERRSCGTSFSAAIVAGAAALWLQRHNRDTLIAQLSGRSTLQALFREHLRRTARRPAGWNTLLDGPGILNLIGLMDVRTMPDARRFPFPPIIDDIGNLLGVDTTGVAGNRFTPPAWVETLFGDRAEAVVDQVGEELVTILMSDPALAALAQLIGETADAAADAADAVGDAASDAVDAAQGLVEAVVEETEERVEEFVDAVTDTASDVFNTVTGWFT